MLACAGEGLQSFPGDIFNHVFIIIGSVLVLHQPFKDILLAKQIT